jgi:site-specific DNA recombinase
MSAEWRAEQDHCLREIERHQAADEEVRLLELARNAQQLFEKQEAREKRRLLDFVVSNCTWKGGDLVVNLRQPFDPLAEMASIAGHAAAGSKLNLAKNLDLARLPGYVSNSMPRAKS